MHTSREPQGSVTAGQAFNLVTAQEDDATVIRVAGELDLASADELDQAIRKAEETGIGTIVVNLSDLSFIDSTGLSVLLRARTRARQDGERLRFVRSRHDAVTRLLALTDTRHLFD